MSPPVTAPDGKDLDALIAEIKRPALSRSLEETSRGDWPVHHEAMPDDTGPADPAGPRRSTCGSYSCTGAVSGSGASDPHRYVAG